MVSSRKRGLTKFSCLTRTDKTSPFRWMGVWCAVYASDVHLKAERRPERACRRFSPRKEKRPANRRGHGASVRRKEERALTRSVPRLNETVMPQAIDRSMRKLSRIGKTDDRFKKQVYRTLESLARESRVLDELGDSFGKEVPTSGITAKRVDFLENLAVSRYLGIRRMTERLLLACEGHWGLPRDDTLRRLRMVTERAGNKLYFSDDPIWRAIPRWKPSAITSHYDELSIVRFKHEVRRCVCKICRLATICPNEHYVNPGSINCRFCEWVRHEGEIAGRSRTSNNRPRERNHPQGATRGRR